MIRLRSLIFVAIFLIGMAVGMIITYFIHPNAVSLGKIQSSNFIKKTNLDKKLGLKDEKTGEGTGVILMYHHVQDVGSTNKLESDLSVSLKNFEEQMEFLYRMGYRTMALAKMAEDVKKGSVSDKSVVLTFDDGYDDFLKNAHPILKKYDFKSTIFVITDKIGQGGYLNDEEIRELSEWGVEIGSHSLSHPNLVNTGRHEVERQLSESKRVLEGLLDKKVTSFCYPSGKYDKSVKDTVEAVGYGQAVTIVEGLVEEGNDLFLLNRMRMRGAMKLKDFIGKVLVD